MKVTVSTHYKTWQCEEDFSLALATEKIAKMAVEDVPARLLWARVTDIESGALLHQCWWENGMLHTWSAATNCEDEMILFL